MVHNIMCLSSTYTKILLNKIRIRACACVLSICLRDAIRYKVNEFSTLSVFVLSFDIILTAASESPNPNIRCKQDNKSYLFFSCDCGLADMELLLSLPFSWHALVSFLYRSESSYGKISYQMRTT
jgi:hypothetical protein